MDLDVLSAVLSAVLAGPTVTAIDMTTKTLNKALLMTFLPVQLLRTNDALKTEYPDYSTVAGMTRQIWHEISWRANVRSVCGGIIGEQR